MPYSNEYANKASHSDIVRNPEVIKFLADCEYLKEPNDEEAKAMTGKWVEAPKDDVSLPARAIAFDGSFHESTIDEKLPSTKVGYVKVGSIMINLSEFGGLRTDGLVDPFRVARLRENNDALSFCLPSANIKAKGRATVIETFRAAVDDGLDGSRTRFLDTDPATSLRATLFYLASLRTGHLSTNGDESRLFLHRCPSCHVEKIEVKNVQGAQSCPHCQQQVFAADVLRLYEEASELQSNSVPMSRFMLLVEHMLPVHYCRYLLSKDPAVLSGTAFFIDGPLAVFGTAAWLHACILAALGDINAALTKLGHKPLIVVGLQKSGQVVDHAQLMSRFVSADRLLSVDDEYRYKYILCGREPAANGFGAEDYYGHDFIYRTPTGRTFVFGMPFPTRAKASLPDFVEAKAELVRYPMLATALALIRHFETDLYENAVIPIALAHRYTAISLVPGGRVLDVMTRKALESKDSA